MICKQSYFKQKLNGKQDLIQTSLYICNLIFFLEDHLKFNFENEKSGPPFLWLTFHLEVTINRGSVDKIRISINPSICRSSVFMKCWHYVESKGFTSP